MAWITKVTVAIETETETVTMILGIIETVTMEIEALSLESMQRLLDSVTTVAVATRAVIMAITASIQLSPSP